MAFKALPTRFRKSPDAIVNVDFFDLAAGVGIKTFYAADVNSDTKDTVGERILTTSVIYSSVGFTNTASTGDYDFDIVLTRPLRIKGECVINIPFKFTNTVGGGTEAISTITATVKHRDDSGVTSLGTETTLAAVTVLISESRVASIATIRLDITEKQFAKGDTLRLTIAHTQAGGAEELSIGHDPKGRITIDAGVGGGGGREWLTTALTMQLPIIVDI